MASNLALILHGFVATQPVGSVDRGIAEYILAHMDEMDGMTSGRLAQACAVSRPTVSRFIQTLGFVDYASFQRACILWKRDVGDHFGVAAASPAPSTMGYLAGAERSLAAVKDAIDERALTDAAKSIVRASRRVVMGGMQAGDIASMFHHDLFQAGLYAQVLASVADQRIALAHLEEGACAVIFSELGTFFNRVDVAALAGTKPPSSRIVLVTCAPAEDAPGRAPVDHVLRCPAGPAVWESGITLVMLAQLLAIACRNVQKGC